MIQKMYSFPMVRVYRSFDKKEYVFMEMAEVDPGHNVGWGKLVSMDHESAVLNALPFVTESLEKFAERDGNDKESRLKLNPREPLHKTYDVVSVRKIAGDKLEMTPYSRGDLQPNRIEKNQHTVGLGIAPTDFFNQLNSLFDLGMAKLL